MTKKTVIVNLFGGPGSGKSTQSAGLFYKLKMNSFDCELINEYAKWCTWEKNWTALSDQFMVSGQQHYKQHMLVGQVDAIITDSPLLLGLVYYKEEDPVIRKSFVDLLTSVFNRNNNIVFLMKRKKVYNPNGRNQTEEEAKEVDTQIRNMLVEYKIEYTEIDGTPEGLEQMYNITVNKVNSHK